MKITEITSSPISGDAGMPLYSGVEDKFFGTPGAWNFRRDPTDNHIWLENRPATESIHEIYTRYYTHHPSPRSNILEPLRELASAKLGYSSTVRNPLRAKILSALPSLMRASELEFLALPNGVFRTVLDYGCGAGNLIRLFREHGKVCYGYDPDPSALRHLEGTGVTVLKTEDEIQSSDSKFDVIVLSHVIEHLPDPLKTISLLASKLSENGRIVIVTPNSKSLGHRLFRRNWRGLEAPRHFNIFSPSSITKLGADVGLTCEVRTESRLARGIFFTSAMSALAHKEIELLKDQNAALKVAGYVFQIVEHGLSKIFPEIGEEIYATLRWE